MTPPDRDGSLDDTAASLLREQKFDEYLRLTSRLVTEQPDEPRIRLHHGIALSLLGRRDEARDEIVFAATRAPNDPELLARAASAMYRLRQFKLSQDYVTQASGLVKLSEFSLGTDLVHLAGLLAAQRSDHERARTLLQAAVDVGPADISHARYAKVLARYLVVQGDIEASREVVRKALVDHPDDDELRRLRDSELAELQLAVKRRGDATAT